MTRAAGTVLHLTDAHDRFDRRVLAGVAADGPGARLDVLDREPGWPDRIAAAILVWLWLAPALVFYGRALARMGRHRRLPRGTMFSGTRRLTADVARALRYVRGERAQLPHVERIRANDQACGLVALIAWRVWGVPYVYDAHEMVPFRNRSYGLARRSVEAWLEGRILRSARESVVVNRPIRSFYRRFYRVRSVGVRVNDFYPARTPAIDDAGAPCLLYVGAAGGGRLAELAAAAKKLRCRTLLAVDRPAAAKQQLPSATVVGLDGYEDMVANALSGTAPYMWCHLDATVLSYRFSLPNKFFQALAFGMPIVAAPGTYLARIVRVHGVGVVADAGALDPAELWDPALYAARRAAVRALRAKLAETKELL